MSSEETKDTARDTRPHMVVKSMRRQQKPDGSPGQWLARFDIDHCEDLAAMVCMVRMLLGTLAGNVDGIKVGSPLHFLGIASFDIAFDIKGQPMDMAGLADALEFSFNRADDEMWQMCGRYRAEADGMLRAADVLAEKATTPRQHRESEIQRACVKWFRLKYKKYAPLLFSVPNGMLTSATQARIAKAEGLTAGASDLILLVPSSRGAALCIEMKAAKGKQSTEQKCWQRSVEWQGYSYEIVRSIWQFTELVSGWMADHEQQEAERPKGGANGGVSIS